MFEIEGTTELDQDVSSFEAPDLTPEQMTEHYANMVAQSLAQTGLIEVREVQANLVNQLHILCRVKEKNARQVAQKLVKDLLRRTEASTDVEAFICKQYLLRDNDVVYAWVFSFGGPDVRRVAQIVCETIDASIPRKKVEVLEAPLMGTGTPASSGPGSKGAAPLRG